MMMRRGKLLDDYPLTLGASWAHGLYEETLQQRRLVDGGFPGTLSEARSRVVQHLGSELARRELPPLSPSELAVAVDAAYSRARRDWLEVVRNLKVEAQRRRNEEPNR
jgi:hypothetical protein